MIRLTLVSKNVKTGPIPVSTSDKSTCPDTCPLKGQGCYAEGGPLAIHWRKLSREDNYLQFLQQIKGLPAGQAWRHNQAGDLAGDNNVIDADKLAALTAANKGKRGWTYTHKPLNKDNLKAIRAANEGGFTINVSCDSFQEVDRVKKLGLPTVVVVPSDSPLKGETPEGNRWVVCPAQYKDVNCADCLLCQKQRSVTVAFQAHGIKKKTVNANL